MPPLKYGLPSHQPQVMLSMKLISAVYLSYISNFETAIQKMITLINTCCTRSCLVKLVQFHRPTLPEKLAGLCNKGNFKILRDILTKILIKFVYIYICML